MPEDQGDQRCAHLLAWSEYQVRQLLTRPDAQRASGVSHKRGCPLAWPSYRFWCDGNSSEGPICRKWNVTSWPTLYVLDSRGVIRYKHLLDKDLIEAVTLLLKETQDDGVKPSS